jgi:hypothetical protein
VKRLNWKVILSNLSEARRELEKLEGLAVDAKHRSEVELEIGLAHAYYHLNFAWHVRRVPMSRYANLTDQDFNRWGRFPRNVELPHLESRRASKRLQPNSAMQRPADGRR